jgi:hypothetical protein
MVYNLSTSKKEFKNTADELLGSKPSFLSQFTIGNRKSPLMKIIDFHGTKWTFLNDERPLKGYIVLRPEGIVIRIITVKNSYAWVVPFYKLQIFKSNGLHLFADGSKISFQSNKLSSRFKRFTAKLMLLKLEHESSRELMGSYDI